MSSLCFAERADQVKVSRGKVHNSNVKILAVDDNDAIRYSLVRSLRDAGYQVVEAKTSAEVLARAVELPDLIVLDVHLPDIIGFEVCQRLKTDPRTAHIPILHLSSTFIDPDARVLGLSSGADAYLTEPVDRAELVATVSALLRLKTAENALRQRAMVADDAHRNLARLNETLERRVAERTVELKSLSHSLSELSRRLLRSQDEERRRIARELHDSVGQLLVAIKMNNATLTNQLAAIAPGTLEAVAKNDALVDEVLRSIRTISHLLHPPLLDEAGLASALRMYVEEFSARSGIRVNLQCEESVGRFSTEAETTFFRIVQECLGNVHRHAASASASIRLFSQDGNARLEVKDEGRGIPSDRLCELALGGGGVGLRGMRERVAESGGDLHIESDTSGTKVTVTIPWVNTQVREPESVSDPKQFG